MNNITFGAIAATLAFTASCGGSSGCPDASCDAATNHDAHATLNDAVAPTADASSAPDASAAADASALSSDAALSATGIPAIGPRVVLGTADFESAQVRPTQAAMGASWYGGGGAQLRVENGALRVDYPDGQSYPSVGLAIAAVDSREVFIQFRARMPGPRGGFKFFKVFGYNPRDNSLTGWNGSVASNYANSTFGLDYTGIEDGKGSLYYIGFGDGTETENDTANGIWLAGGNARGIGRSFGRATVSTPQMRNFRAADWGDGWHTFRMMMRFNSGTTAATEVADGSYFLEIDGRVFVRATGVLNRHWSNRPLIDRVEIAGWSQSNDGPFSVWYDDVQITTGSF